MKTLLVLVLLGMLFEVESYRLLPAIRKRWRRRRPPPTVVLPQLDSFKLIPSQKTVQAQGWRDTLVSIGNELHRSSSLPTKAQKETIRSIALALETVQPTPTKAPALSPFNQGRWALLYTDAPGISSGRIGPFGLIKGRVFQEVDLTTRGYVNILEVSKPGQAPWLEAKLTAEFQVVDDTDWEVTFKDVVGMLRGKQVVKQVFSGVSRVWTHTYLDREGGVRIMRARRPEKRPEDAFLFVLVRRKEREREEGEGR
ncbi:harpin binding protein 1 [Nannochloropsis oceanica]